VVVFVTPCYFIAVFFCFVLFFVILQQELSRHQSKYKTGKRKKKQSGWFHILFLFLFLFFIFYLFFIYFLFFTWLSLNLQ